MTDMLFEDARLALQSKCGDLCKQGLGNRLNWSISVGEAEEALFWEEGVFLCHIPFFIAFYNVVLSYCVHGVNGL